MEVKHSTEERDAIYIYPPVIYNTATFNCTAIQFHSETSRSADPLHGDDTHIFGNHWIDEIARLHI